MYRLHFGHFGGWWTKVIYLLLGLALTIISVSGINIWLAKRKYKDAINHVWTGFVWGAPIALILPAITLFSIGIISNSIFWGGLLLCCLYAYIIKNEGRAANTLKRIYSVLALILIIIYHMKFGRHAFSGIAMAINSSILLSAAVFLYMGRKKYIKDE